MQVGNEHASQRLKIWIGVMAVMPIIVAVWVLQWRVGVRQVEPQPLSSENQEDSFQARQEVQEVLEALPSMEEIEARATAAVLRDKAIDQLSEDLMTPGGNEQRVTGNE